MQKFIKITVDDSYFLRVKEKGDWEVFTIYEPKQQRGEPPRYFEYLGGLTFQEVYTPDRNRSAVNLYKCKEYRPHYMKKVPWIIIDQLGLEYQ